MMGGGGGDVVPVRHDGDLRHISIFF